MSTLHTLPIKKGPGELISRILSQLTQKVLAEKTDLTPAQRRRIFECEFTLNQNISRVTALEYWTKTDRRPSSYRKIEIQPDDDLADYLFQRIHWMNTFLKE
jgi:hypothetical protein